MRVLLPVALAIALASPAMAQAASDPHHPSAKAAAAPSGPQGAIGMMQGMMRCPMAGHTEGTLAFLKTELNITPTQNEAWEAFATAYRDLAKSQGSMMGEGMMGEGMMGGGMMGGGMMGGGMMDGDAKGGMMAKPLPDRLAIHTQMMERRLDAAKKFQAAVQPLYDALDAKQKKAADEMMPMIGMMGVM